MSSFQGKKKVFAFSNRGNVLTLQTAHGYFLMLGQMVLLHNINFLICKQNRSPNIDPNMLKQ